MRRTLGRLALSTEPDSPVQVVQNIHRYQKVWGTLSPSLCSTPLDSRHPSCWAVKERWQTLVSISRISHKSPLAALDHFKRGTSASIHFMWRGSERLGPTQGSFSRFHEPTKANMLNYMCCQRQRWFPLVHVKDFYCCDAFPWPQSMMQAQCTVACAAIIKPATCGLIQSNSAHSCMEWNI